MDGVYETSLNSPMGNIQIRIALQQNGNVINGMLEIMGNKYPLSTGKANANKCYFIGELRNNSMGLKYEIMGELNNNVLNIRAKTNMGEFKMQANKIA